VSSVQELSDKIICFVNDGSVIDDTVTIPCMICKLLAAVRFFLVKKKPCSRFTDITVGTVTQGGL